MERRAPTAHVICASAAQRALAVCFARYQLGYTGARSGSGVYIAFVTIKIAESDFVKSISANGFSTIKVDQPVEFGASRVPLWLALPRSTIAAGVSF